MATLKSREFECPEDLAIAIANLHTTKMNLTSLARKLNHQAGLFNDDVTMTVMHDASDEVFEYTKPIQALINEVSAFLNSLK